MEEDIVFILYKTERIFSPVFFDIMVHLAVHLPRQAILAGPYVCNMERPEGSIVEGYVVNETLTFSSLYMSQIESRFTRSELRVMSSQRNHKLPLALHKKLHWYVLNNCKEVDRYRNEHLQILLSRNPSSCILQCHEEQFLQNQKNPEAIDELYSLSLGPDVEVELYDACIVNGVRYHTLSRDTHRTTQNSGVSVPSFDEGDNLDFFGVLKDVVLIFYTFGYKVHLFWCDWFQCNPKKKSVDDPFILATEARQVYYLDDIKHEKRWKVVQKVQHREIYEITEKEDKNSEEHEFENSYNNELNQEISSDEISLSVHEDLEISDLCRLNIQPQYIELLDTQASFSENMHNFINNEYEDTQLDSEGEEQMSDDGTN
ncbi:hypothetical protein Pfo_031037 [Paulownia fortunei]|nr:hypothetical protein Pfo_031037 [Paulownia fortunei]